jgi:hypothetical protein
VNNRSGILTAPIFPGKPFDSNATSLGVFSQLITTLKVAGKEDWPIANTGFPLGEFFKPIPFRSDVAILMESDDVAAALMGCEEMVSKHLDTLECRPWPPWREMIAI